MVITGKWRWNTERKYIDYEHKKESNKVLKGTTYCRHKPTLKGLSSGL